MSPSSLLERALEMRNAIDMLESAMMGLSDFVDIPEAFEGASDEVKLAPKMTLGLVRRVCEALSECTRIINSDEFRAEALQRVQQERQT